MTNNGCVGCHQLGNLATRTIPEALGEFENSEQAWMRRIQSGQAGGNMLRPLTADLGGVPFKYFGDWTDRIAAGELPAFIPERPQGIERNIVATVRDWADPSSYLHDLASTDRRNPTVNAYGLLFGSPELSTDNFPILDPTTNVATTFKAPVRDADTPTTNSAPVVQPSPYWGDERIWDSQANSHNPMLDESGARLVHGPGSEARRIRPSAGKVPITPRPRCSQRRAPGGISRFAIPRRANTPLSTRVFSTHHLQFAEDENNTLWTSGGGDVVGWLDTKLFLETGDAELAQGWTPAILDTNGNGKRDAWVEPGERMDPAAGHANQVSLLRHHAEPGGWLDLGVESNISGFRRPDRSGPEPIGDSNCRGV